MPCQTSSLASKARWVVAQAGSQSPGQPASDWSEPATVTDVGFGVWDAKALVVGSSDATRTAAISTERSRFVRIDG